MDRSRTIVRRGLFFGALALGLWGVLPLGEAAEGLDHLASAAQAAGLLADDLSPAFALEGGLPLRHPLRRRPSLTGFASLASVEPAVRVYYPDQPIPGVRDNDRNGVPDRAETALNLAVRTLEFCRARGFGEPAEVGRSELEFFLVPLGGTVRGFAALEQGTSPQGAAGFGVIDCSPSQDDPSFRGMVARVAARLVLAARSSDIPGWWAEPSAFWIQSQITGIDLEMERDLLARMNHPERGVDTSDMVLARGNLALILALQDPVLEGQALAAVWNALGGSSPGEPLPTVIDRVLKLQTGMTLSDLFLRAGIAQIVDGPAPGRWSMRLSNLPVLDGSSALPVSPTGMTLTLLTPDPAFPESTMVSLQPNEEGWTMVLLAQRRGGEWETSTLNSGDGGIFELKMPWRDYQRGVILAVRPGQTSGLGSVRVRAEGLAKNEFFGLSSFGAQALTGRRLMVSWASAWEEGLFGWLVERALSPEGPWTPIHEVPVPSLGTAGEGTEYWVQDTPPGRSGTLYYRLAALTSLGLHISGPAVAVRDPAP